MPTHQDHNHTSPRKTASQGLRLTLLILAVYMVAEVFGGLLSGSLALLADAGHMLADVGALALSLFAIRMAARPATAHRTYGHYRAEILAALVNGSALVAIAIFVFIEAVRRLATPSEVMGGTMLAVAAGGLAVNLAGMWILHGGRNDSLNLRGAWLHLVSDALGSLGAITAGLLVWTYGWNWADPAASIIIGLLVVHSAWNLIKEAVAVLMEGSPGHIDVDQVRDAILSLAAVRELHDLHIWTITSGLEALSGHVVARDGADEQALLAEVRALLHKRFSIDHITIQIEAAGFAEPEVCP